MIVRARKRPVEIDALRFDGTNAADIASFVGATVDVGIDEQGELWLEIPTLEGVMRAHQGDWIIRGVVGECYPCREDVFAQTYEVLDTTAAAESS